MLETALDLETIVYSVEGRNEIDKFTHPAAWKQRKPMTLSNLMRFLGGMSR